MSKFFDYKIKYRTVDQLMNSVADDWPGFDAESLIDPSQLIRVVRKVNKQLGLRITKTKEKLIDFTNHAVKLPTDMESINFAVVCTYYKTSVPAIQGDITENINVDCGEGCGDVYIGDDGNTFVIVQKILPSIEKIFRIEKRVNIKHSMYQVKHGEVAGVIQGDNFMRMTLRSGKLYLNYEGVLEDEEGNLLVIDHPLINDYYEYSIKERILENMYFSGEDTERKLAYIIPKLQSAKREAYNVANMPEFKELQETLDINREAMYKRYFSIII